MFIRDIFKESSFRLGDPSTWLSLVKNAAFFQVFYNFLMVMPFGIYLRYYFRCSFKRTLLFSFLLSLFFELTQLSGLYFIYPRGYRLFDVDDLMSNTLGGAAGYLCAPALMRLLPSRENMDKASLRRGQEISLTRRLLALCFDLFLIFIVNSVLLALITLVPTLTGGRTLGKLILRMRIAGTDGARPKWYQYALRCGSLLAYLFTLPPLLSLPTFLVWFFYLLWTAILAVRHRELFYERLSRTKNVSTVSCEDP